MIGRTGTLPWHLPDDTRRFRRITTGHHVLMGRLTFESIGRALPDRVNVVVSRSAITLPRDVWRARNLQEALTLACSAGETEAFVIGGTSLYKEALPLAETLHLTRVHAQVEGDTRFPELPPGEWVEVSREPHPADDRHGLAFTYTVLRRIIGSSGQTAASEG